MAQQLNGETICFPSQPWPPRASHDDQSAGAAAPATPALRPQNQKVVLITCRAARRPASARYNRLAKSTLAPANSHSWPKRQRTGAHSVLFLRESSSGGLRRVEASPGLAGFVPTWGQFSPFYYRTSPYLTGT